MFSDFFKGVLGENNVAGIGNNDAEKEEDRDERCDSALESALGEMKI